MQIPEAYEVVEKRRIEDLNSESLLLKHKKTGARVALLSNDDENKVFYIAFRTPPEDSTGVAHIIEHTVLCGSREFPVKDPFIELAKGSLNTFLNAMTYPDKTVYPVASCNDKDFANLMHVYLDAVFYPDIYREERIFRQEGWHYEMETAEDPVTINGVVYNEMKGAFSSPDDVLDRQITTSLYPDTTYGIESGGDPEFIPDLTYADYLDFHRRYYHPSNSYIYLYGDMDFTERLTFLDEAYLSHFDALHVDSEVGLQEPFDAARETVCPYPVLAGEDERKKTYLAWNVSVGTSLDPKLTIAFDAIDYALCASPGAVIRKALIDAGIGQEVYGTWDAGIRQPYYSIVAKNADPEQKEEFLRIISATLAEQVEKGFDKKALLAALNNAEFKYREADFGRYPKGLLYGLQMLDSWLYDDMLPWIHIESGEIYKELKKEVEGRYFEELTKKYLIDNPHRSVVLLTPKKGLTEEREAALKEKLAAYKESLTKEEIDRIVAETASLKAWQEEPDDPADLARIPMLKREDMRRGIEHYPTRETACADVPVLYHDVSTNGIVYLTFAFDLDGLPREYLPYAGVLRSLLGMMDTAEHTYGELANEINIRTGGIGPGINSYPVGDTEKFRLKFEINAKVLNEHIADAFELAREIIASTRFDDPVRLKEIFEETRTRGRSVLASSGNLTAAMRALAPISDRAAVSDALSGVSALRLLEQLCVDVRDEAGAKRLADIFSALSGMIFRRENLLLDVTSTGAEADAAVQEQLEAFTAGLEVSRSSMPADRTFVFPQFSEGPQAYTTPGQVQYVALAGNFRKHGVPYSGALQVLRVIMGYGYLWQNIRVKGGAYGCSSAYRRGGDAYFVSYRDPHLERSLQVFREAADYVRSFTADERTMTQYLIGTLSDLDAPKTPSAKGAAAMGIYLSGLTEEQRQKRRDEILDVQEEDIRALAPVLDAVVADGLICVVGSEDKIRTHEALFASVEPLAGS
ncbi:MAG: insulinase family protein [Lachnospiraceae bacterium]|nr:insulinase family protein [Lachnospiraceae bacterium]